MKHRMAFSHTIPISLLSLFFWAFNGERALADSVKGDAIEFIGIYNCYTGMPPAAIPFFQACGYNTYQRWDLGWTQWPAHLDGYYADMALDVQRMQRAGFKVYVLLSVNMEQRQPGEPEGYRESLFDPADDALMQNRLEYIARAVRALKTADGFSIGAGDPGGHSRAKPAQVIDAAKKIIRIVAREAPKAEINVNTWGIAAWDGFPSPFGVAFWEKEVQLTRQLFEQPDVVGPNVGEEFPLHNYYRSLALKCYVDAGKPPELLPSTDDIAVLKRRGVKRLWGWPYFVTDQCDDGFAPPGTTGTAQSETRYIKQIVDTGRQLGLNGMIANAMAENISAKSLNLYAFGRFCKDPAATPEQVTAEFAGFISEPKTAGDLAEIIRFIENHSTWEAGMPSKHRLPGFDVQGLRSAKDACEALAKVAVREHCPLPMSESPAAYAGKLKQTLELLAKKEKPSR
jgi:hypothetical protein